MCLKSWRRHSLVSAESRRATGQSSVRACSPPTFRARRPPAPTSQSAEQWTTTARRRTAGCGRALAWMGWGRPSAPPSRLLTRASGLLTAADCDRWLSAVLGRADSRSLCLPRETDPQATQTTCSANCRGGILLALRHAGNGSLECWAAYTDNDPRATNTGHGAAARIGSPMRLEMETRMTMKKKLIAILALSTALVAGCDKTRVTSFPLSAIVRSASGEFEAYLKVKRIRVSRSGACGPAAQGLRGTGGAGRCDRRRETCSMRRNSVRRSSSPEELLMGRYLDKFLSEQAGPMR